MSKKYYLLALLVSWLISTWFILELLKVVNIPINSPNEPINSEVGSVVSRGVFLFWIILPMTFFINFILGIIFLIRKERFRSKNKISKAIAIPQFIVMILMVWIFLIRLTLFM